MVTGLTHQKEKRSMEHFAGLDVSVRFSHVKKLVDMGGGHGGTLAAILGQYPSMRGILFDLSNVVARAY